MARCADRRGADRGAPRSVATGGIRLTAGPALTMRQPTAAYNGTTSVDFLKNTLGVNPTIFPNSQTLYQGVISGQVDAAFLDTAIVLAEAKASNGNLKVVGQYATGEKYGAIYPKGSANEDAFNTGIESMLKDGTLEGLSKTYLGPAFGGDPNDVPVWTVQ